MSDTIPGRTLDERLAALPRELPPHRDLWPAIDAAIAPRARPSSRWSYALAAGVAVATLGMLVGVRLAREAAPAGAGRPVVDAALVAARLKSSEDADYLATRAQLERTYRERLALLAPDTRARIEQDLATIQRAQEDIRRALARDPGSRVLLELLQSTAEQEFNLYATVGDSTEPLASRTRT
jgi:hypothetical protein